MRIINCVKGHFYDADMFPECPHCLGEINKDIPLQSTSVMRRKMNGVNDGEMPVPEAPVNMTVPTQEAIPESKTKIRTDLNQDNMNDKKSVDDRKKKLVVGWLVCIEGEDRGEVSTIYNESNMIYGLNIVFNEELNRIYLNLLFSETVPDINNRRISDSEYIYDQDKLRIGKNTYMVVELCKGGFSWKKKQTDGRTNSEILRSMWKCGVCGAMNGEFDGYCLVCGAEKQ